MVEEIWRSFRRLPVWVQLWMSCWLVPVNLIPLFFLGQGMSSHWIAVLALAGVLPNLGILLRDRGFSSLMALPHLIFWTPLVFLICLTLLENGADGTYQLMLIVLLATNFISLVFDLRDWVAWCAGNRDVA